MEPIYIETMTAEKATEFLRACGVKISVEKLRIGIRQKQYPFGTILMDGERVMTCTIYARQLYDWVRERASEVA